MPLLKFLGTADKYFEKCCIFLAPGRMEDDFMRETSDIIDTESAQLRRIGLHC